MKSNGRMATSLDRLKHFIMTHLYRKRKEETRTTKNMKSGQINGYLLWKNGGKTNELGIAGTIIYPFGRKKYIQASLTQPR